MHDALVTLRERRPGALALSVHLFTATGAVLAMLAMIAAVQAQWELMFAWLLIAFIVDGIDGPLARKFDVKTHAPQFDGTLLDLIIDYLTYVFVPALAVFYSGLMPGWSGWAAIIIITFASALYFCDTRMKTEDNSFSGFPGCWNMVVLVMFATEPYPWVSMAFIVVLAALMFAPVKFVHPVRTRQWRIMTLPIAMIWTICAAWSAWFEFKLGSLPYWLLIGSTAYLILIGAVQQAVQRYSDHRSA